MDRVLDAKYDYVYQLALLTTELHEIFDASPVLDDHSSYDTRQRSPIEGDCPICLTEFGDHQRLAAGSNDAVVWCRASCGRNLHRECFEIWARGQEDQPTCPMCRSAWGVDDTSVQTFGIENGMQVSRSTLSFPLASAGGSRLLRVGDDSTFLLADLGYDACRLR
jgi:hypothetical protein